MTSTVPWTAPRSGPVAGQIPASRDMTCVLRCGRHRCNRPWRTLSGTVWGRCRICTSRSSGGHDGHSPARTAIRQRLRRWSVVKRGCDTIKVVAAPASHVSALREALAQQAVGVSRWCRAATGCAGLESESRPARRCRQSAACRDPVETALRRRSEFAVGTAGAGKGPTDAPPRSLTGDLRTQDH